MQTLGVGVVTSGKGRVDGTVVGPPVHTVEWVEVEAIFGDDAIGVVEVVGVAQEVLEMALLRRGGWRGCDVSAGEKLES